jgi:peptidoglycan hydrolase-like protein with peptidoglycan-binding domain
MRRTTAALAVGGAVLAATVALAGPAGASTPAPAPAPAATRSASSAAPSATTSPAAEALLPGRDWSWRSPFAREVSRFRDRDRGPRAIEHVVELQYRLRWVGAYKGPVDGFYDVKVRSAVYKYQKRAGLRANGVATHETWAKLIHQTIKGRSLIPRECRNDRGWHACYDRYRHQITLWHNGKLRNSWLVRGGDRGYETRVGDFQVFLRDKDHVSGIYGTPMPYSQFFSGGQAFHGSPFMTDPWQDHSHGCVNMFIEDARQLWVLTSGVTLGVHINGKWDRMVGSEVGARRLDIFG